MKNIKQHFLIIGFGTTHLQFIFSMDPDSLQFIFLLDPDFLQLGITEFKCS